jgi:hypothetical protein
VYVTQGNETDGANGLWYAAFKRFAVYSDETVALVHLHMTSVRRLIGVPQFLKEAFYEPEDSDWFVSASKQAALAEDEASKGFPLLHAHSLLGIWSALEALVEDAAVAWLIVRPDTLRRSEFAKIRVPVVEYNSLSNEEQMAFLVAEVQRDTRADQRPGIARFEKLLDAIGMKGSVPREVGKAVYEAQQVRNVFAHRGGVIDRKLAAACPWLELSPNRPLTIDHKEFTYYLKGIHLYVMEILNRFRTSAGMKPIAYDLSSLKKTSDEAQREENASDEV